jgi:acetate kinase
MNILVINSGSSTVKYQLIDMTNENVLAKGVCDRIGLDNAFIKHTKVNAAPVVIEKDMYSHKVAIQELIAVLTDKEHGVITSMDEINAIGHRVVHGAEEFTGSVVITDRVIEVLEECTELAPIHNPPNITGIEACKTLMPTTKMVGVFDTAFHQTMPKHAYIYPVPYEYYEKYGVRKYGFHGTSHNYVANKAAELLDKPIEELKIITCHLGSGASICAVKNGKSVETTMGFTPLEGLCMSTRAGSIDPAAVLFLMDKEKLSIDEITTILNKKSGVFGISGVSSDFREIEDAAKSGNERAQLAEEVFAYKVRRYIGDYTAVMGGVDAIVFTAGVGENNPAMRKQILTGLEYLGVSVDDEKNNVRGKLVDFSQDEATVRTLLVPTDEELAIARETYRLLK